MELQRQLPGLTGGEGNLESFFDGYQPVQRRAPEAVLDFGEHQAVVTDTAP